MKDLSALFAQHYQALLAHVDQRIAQRLAEVGFIGNRLDAGAIRGALPGGSLPSHTHTVTMSGQVVVMAVEGSLSVAAGALRFYNHLGGDVTITSVLAAVGTAPTGAALIVDVHKDGATLFTTQANRPQVAAGANVSSAAVPDVTAWGAGEYLTVDIDQVGSTVAGAALTVHVAYTYEAETS